MNIRFKNNAFFALVPILVWNLLFWPQLPSTAGGTGEVPASMTVLETIFRSIVFVYPIFFKIRLESLVKYPAVVSYVTGHALYFLSWAPWLLGFEHESTIWIIGPYVTPSIILLTLAFLLRSRTYAAATVCFILIHTFGGLFKANIL